MLAVFISDTALLYSLPYHISTLVYDTGTYKLILNACLHFIIFILYRSSSASSN